jgi:hypothetical protein
MTDKIIIRAMEPDELNAIAGPAKGPEGPARRGTK